MNRRRGLLAAFWLASSLGLSMVVLVTTAPPAGASTCGFSGRKLVEVQTVNNWEGIEGNISDDALTTGDSSNLDDHAVAGLSADNFSSTNCTGTSDHHCWIQAGDGTGFIGTIGGYGHSSGSVAVYEENNDDNGYNNGFYPNLALDTDNHYSIFNTWILDGQGNAIAWYACSTTLNGTVTHIGTGWFPDTNLFQNMTGSVLGEAFQYSGDTVESCPFFPLEQGFGYTDSGTVTGSSGINLSSNGTTWSLWNTTIDGGPPSIVGASPHYTGPTFSDNYYAWTMYGRG
jgi:hypothetical protein